MQKHPPFSIPSAYVPQYEKIREQDPERVDNYVKHTVLGDPVLDPVLEAIIPGLQPQDLHRFVQAGIEENGTILRQAPQEMRNFFANLDEPEWLDFSEFRPGIRAFHVNIDYILVAFIAGVLVEGFSTMIAKSFYITGRVGATSRRLKQNNRQLLESFYPSALERGGDGWKVNVRLRFVHARIRQLLGSSEYWNREDWGCPLSAAHLGFALSVFSQRLLEYSTLLGAQYTTEEKVSFLKVWRYVGYVMGIPETILYTDSEEARKLYKIGYMCEPPPTQDSIDVANTFIQMVPKIADFPEKDWPKYTRLAYRLSRSLIGDKLANRLGYPRGTAVGTLFLYRLKRRLYHLMHGQQFIRSDNFSQLLRISVYEESGLSYKLPTAPHQAESEDW